MAFLYVILSVKLLEAEKATDRIAFFAIFIVYLRRTAGRSVARHAREESPGNTERHTS